LPGISQLARVSSLFDLLILLPSKGPMTRGESGVSRVLKFFVLRQETEREDEEVDSSLWSLSFKSLPDPSTEPSDLLEFVSPFALREDGERGEKTIGIGFNGGLIFPLVGLEEEEKVGLESLFLSVFLSVRSKNEEESLSSPVSPLTTFFSAIVSLWWWFFVFPDFLGEEILEFDDRGDRGLIIGGLAAGFNGITGMGEIGTARGDVVDRILSSGEAGETTGC